LRYRHMMKCRIISPLLGVMRGRFLW